MKPYYRQFKTTLLLVLLANSALAISPREVSAFEDLSEEVKSHVWLDLRNASPPSTMALASFGGILVDETSFEAVVDLKNMDETAITYALSSSMNIGNKDFPDLRTLATLGDTPILRQFIEGYISEALAMGADFLLMPDTNLLAPEEIEILKMFDRQAPDVFIMPTFNPLDAKAKKKDLAQHLNNDELLLSKAPLGKRLEKNLKKLQQKVSPTTIYVPRREPTGHRTISPSLLNSIYDKAIVYAHNQGRRSIPYDKPELFLLTDRPFGDLHQELERYYTVHNALEKQPEPGTLILVDARWRADFFGPVLAQYDPSFQVLALVSGETDLIPRADEYLYFPENNEIHDRKIPQIIFGAKAVQGRRVGKGIHSSLVYETIPNFGKLRFAEPEWVGLSSLGLQGIEALAQDMIERQAAPGCQIAIIKNGAIVYDKAFGYLTYDSLLPVNAHTLYDVASITKVSATLLAVMHLYEQGKFQMTDSIAQHLAQYQKSNKGHITVQQLLAHHAGLRSYEALWRRKFSGDLLEPFSYASAEDSINDVRSYGLPVHPVMADSIRSWLVQSPLLRKQNRYHYSDLGFMILQQLIEEMAGMSMEQYVFNHFYAPMGLHRTAFNPREKGYEIFEIAPTEYDHRYRKSLVWGDVHDRNAAIFGGVAGHAGLFSSAKELSILMHMIVNDGYYAGRQYLKPQTIATFNQQYFDNNRRALGWDKYDPNIGNASNHVSPSSFGHTGFTGTMVWADPEHDLVYAFVSNRIYPDARNGKLMKYEVREKIQDVIYQSILVHQ